MLAIASGPKGERSGPKPSAAPRGHGTGARVGATSPTRDLASREGNAGPAWAAPRLPAVLGARFVMQRKCAACTEEDAQRSVRRRVAPGGSDRPFDDASLVEAALRGGEPLSPAMRAYFEPRLGYDLSGVRIHRGAVADASARAVSAVAYTVGTDVVFRHGAFAPETAAGKELLAHELAHVAQQAGEAGPAASAGALTIGPADDRLEMEADRVAAAVLRGEGASEAAAAPSAGALQRRDVCDESGACWEEDENASYAPPVDEPNASYMPPGEPNGSYAPSAQAASHPSHDSQVVELIEQYRASSDAKYRDVSPYSDEAFAAWDRAREDYRPISLKGGDPVLRDAEHFLFRYFLSSQRGKSVKIPEGLPLNLPSEYNPAVPMTRDFMENVHDPLYNLARSGADQFFPIAPTTPEMYEWERRGYDYGNPSRVGVEEGFFGKVIGAWSDPMTIAY